MLDVKISGFYDEISTKLSDQIAAVRSFGESYLCPRTVNGKNIAEYTCAEFKRDILPELQKNGIRFSSIGSPIGKISIDDDAAYERQKKQLAELVQIAQVMECKYIRIFSFYYGDRDPDSCFEKVVSRMRGFLEVARGSGVKLMHENEKKIYGDISDRCLRLYQAVNDPDFVLCYDASNFIQCDDDPVRAFDLLKDYVAYYHIKDCSQYKVEVPVGTGLGRYDYIFKQLSERNYSGFMTLEPHTLRYALLKLPVYIIPFMPLIRSDLYKAFRLIDQKMGVRRLQRVSRRQVFVWQYENLKKLIAQNQELEEGYHG